VLDVSYCPEIDNCAMDAIATSAPKLRSLNISGCKFVSQRGLKELRSLPALEVLTASKCDFTDASIREIAALPALRSLSVAGSPRATVNGLKALAALEKLEVLDLSGSPAVTSDVLNALNDRLQKLQSLTLANCSHLANPGLKALGNMKHLHTLNLAGCEQLEACGMGFLVRTLPDLKVLDLSGCADIDDDAVKELTKLSHLQRLDLRGCKNVSAGGAKVLTDALPKLKLDR
jgi:F-box/leucine-rich repeat protein 2/20